MVVTRDTPDWMRTVTRGQFQVPGSPHVLGASDSYTLPVAVGTTLNTLALIVSGVSGTFGWSVTGANTGFIYGSGQGVSTDLMERVAVVPALDPTLNVVVTTAAASAATLYVAVGGDIQQVGAQAVISNPTLPVVIGPGSGNFPITPGSGSGNFPVTPGAGSGNFPIAGSVGVTNDQLPVTSFRSSDTTFTVPGGSSGSATVTLDASTYGLQIIVGSTNSFETSVQVVGVTTGTFYGNFPYLERNFLTVPLTNAFDSQVTVTVGNGNGPEGYVVVTQVPEAVAPTTVQNIPVGNEVLVASGDVFSVGSGATALYSGTSYASPLVLSGFISCVTEGTSGTENTGDAILYAEDAAGTTYFIAGCVCGAQAPGSLGVFPPGGILFQNWNAGSFSINMSYTVRSGTANISALAACHFLAQTVIV